MSIVAQLTLAEYDRMIACGVFDERGRHLELVRGEIREMSPTGPLHEEVIDRLNEWSFRSLPRGRVRPLPQ